MNKTITSIEIRKITGQTRQALLSAKKVHPFWFKQVGWSGRIAIYDLTRINKYLDYRKRVRALKKHLERSIDNYDIPDPIAAGESDRLNAQITKAWDTIPEVKF